MIALLRLFRQTKKALGVFAGKKELLRAGAVRAESVWDQLEGVTCPGALNAGMEEKELPWGSWALPDPPSPIPAHRAPLSPFSQRALRSGFKLEGVVKVTLSHESEEQGSFCQELLWLK